MIDGALSPYVLAQLVQVLSVRAQMGLHMHFFFLGGACLQALDPDLEARCSLSSSPDCYSFHGNDRCRGRKNYSVISTVRARCKVITGHKTPDCLFIALTRTRTDHYLSKFSFFTFLEKICVKERYFTI